MKKKKVALISGDGSWSAFGGGTFERLNNNYDTVIGVSTGSLLAPFVALKEWDRLKEGYTSIDNNDIFDKCWYKTPLISKKGKIKKIPIIMTLLLGERSICTSNALRETINNFLPKEYFDELQKQNKEILVGAQNYAQIPSKIHYFNSTDFEYEDFKDWMWYSANFPLFTSLVKKSWSDVNGKFHVGLWGDGGLTNLIGINELYGKGYDEIDIVLHRPKMIKKYEGNKIKNLIENAITSIDVMRHNIEFECFREKIRRLNKFGIKVTVYWLPRKLSNNSMIFNKGEMISWWQEGYETAFDEDRIEIFEPIKRKL